MMNLIVKKKSGISSQTIENIYNNLAVQEIKGTKIDSLNTLDLELWEIDGQKENSTEEAIAIIEASDAIEYVKPNGIISIEELELEYNELWGINNTGQTGGTPDADIDGREAWQIETGSKDVVVSILDTGIDYTHLDLQDNIWTNENEIPNNNLDDDGNGYIDDYYGYDFYNEDSDPMDDNGHGTHIAGIIGAVGNNNQGVVGVNQEISLMPLKIFDSYGFGTEFDAIQAIEYAKQMGVKLTNNSWSSTTYGEPLQDAIASAGEAGQLFVVAAGNNEDDLDIYSKYPAGYDLDNIISVAATNHRDNLANFSNYGRQSVDLAAPGVDILSTTLENQYEYKNGTSMAAPYVTGVAALLWANNPEKTAEEVKSDLLATVDLIPDLEGKVLSDGRLNAYNALIGGKTGIIAGRKWRDLDADGEKDKNEPSLSGEKIFLDENRNGLHDPGEKFTLTNAKGRYKFRGLTPGEEYIVATVTKPGWFQTYPVFSEDYFWYDSNDAFGLEFQWQDISDLGTEVTLADNDYLELPLPFDFPFYGKIKNFVKISDNGYLTFDSTGQDYLNEVIPSTNAPNDFIAPFWDDLDPSDGGNIYYYHDEAVEQFIVQYQDIPRDFVSNTVVSFQVILNSDGSILFQYDEVRGSLNSATIGVEKRRGRKGSLIKYNGFYVEDDLAVKIVPSSNINAPQTVFINSGEREKKVNFGSASNINQIEPLPIGEVGVITNLNHQETTINLENNYVNPVVIAQPLSFNGEDPAIVRLQNVESDGFTLNIQEPSNLDGYHTTETVSYIVLEAGSWILADGTVIEAGNFQDSDLIPQGWNKVKFSSNFDSKPVVFSQVQTANDPDFVRTRQQKINKNKFQVAMEAEDNLRNSGHLQETIGWLAIERGQGDLNGDNLTGMTYQAGYTGEKVDDNWHSLQFLDSLFRDTPQFIASLASYNGQNSAGLRYLELGTQHVEIKVEKNTTLNSETFHVNENISFLAIEGSGSILTFL